MFFKKNLWPIWALLGFSLLGFFDSLYLLLKYYSKTPLSCSLFEDCERVLISSYATLGPFPVALIGVIYFLLIFLLVFFSFLTKKEDLLNLAAWLTIGGFMASLWFLYLQLFIIQAVCSYCLLSTGLATLLFILGLFVLRWKII